MLQMSVCIVKVLQNVLYVVFCRNIHVKQTKRLLKLLLK